MSPLQREKSTRLVWSMAFTVLFASMMVFLSGCEQGLGFEVGPYPVSIDMGEQKLNPQDSLAASLNIPQLGVLLPLCDLPTREEAEALLNAQVESNVESFVSLSRAEIQTITLYVEEGVLDGIQVSQLYYAGSGLDLLLDGPALIGDAQVIENMVEIVPTGSFDLLEMLEDNESSLEGDCPFVYLTFQGSAPDEPFTVAGQILADVYGFVGLGND